MKKTLALTLALLFIIGAVLTFSACGTKVDENEVITAAQQLIPRTDLINRLFHIEGLPPKEGGQSVGGYREVDMTAIAALGYASLEEILDSMTGIWTADYIARFRESSLFEVVNIGSSQESKYCYDQYHVKTGAYEGIWVSVKGLSNPTDPVEYLYDTITVEKVRNANSVRLRMDVIVTNSENSAESERQGITFTIARENSRAPWLLDSSVVVKYYIEEEI